MIAHDVMIDKVLSVTPDMTLRQIAKILVENGISGVPVVDGENHPIGMVTEKDLIAPTGDGGQKAGRERWLTQLAEGEPLSPEFLANLEHPERTAHEVMSAPVMTIPETADLSHIARLLVDYRIKRLPVVRDGLMVGIVSRADLVRQMAQEHAKPTPTPPHEGILAEAIVTLEDHFSQPPPSPAAVDTEKSDKPTVTAGAFSALVEEFDQQKATQHATDKQAGVEQRKALIQDLTDHHIDDETWQSILRKAQTAATAGQKELLLLRFPCDLCSDGGRAINAPLPDWPETLRGEAAELYHLWERDLQPTGFRLSAQVLDFPGGIPGDIGLTLVWGG
ncbi:CBS domain-containing protein [Telmatospirillum siberiense]|nr:CBS domain-containing protein [Telmatospirillum siberiense]